MSEYDFKQAYKDNEKRLIRLYEEELLITENDFGCIEANENVMRLNYEMLQKELASLHAIIKRQQEELAIAADMLAEERAKVEELESTVQSYRDDFKTIIDKIAHSEWTLDRVRRYAIEVMTYTESADS